MICILFLSYDLGFVAEFCLLSHLRLNNESTSTLNGPKGRLLFRSMPAAKERFLGGWSKKRWIKCLARHQVQNPAHCLGMSWGISKFYRILYNKVGYLVAKLSIMVKETWEPRYVPTGVNVIKSEYLHGRKYFLTHYDIGLSWVLENQEIKYWKQVTYYHMITSEKDSVHIYIY